VQRQITTLLTDILPHITVTVPEPKPTPLSRLQPSQGIISSRIEGQTERQKQIEDWRQALEVIRSIPGVVAAAPAVSGQGFISRGGQRIGATVFGATPEELEAVTPVTKFVYAGRYLGLGADEIVISKRVSEDLGVEVGDRVRLTSTVSLSDSFLIRGIYDTGREQSFGARAYISLRRAQSLYATGNAVQTILVKGKDLFDADRIADRILALLPLKAESWSRENPQIVAGLGAQLAVTYLVSGFSLLASSFAIASVLIVSVLQKSKEIGILKSMGARRRQILVVFLLEGLGIAIVGAVVGSLLGAGVVVALSQIKQPVTRVGGEPEALFPYQLSAPLIAAAMGSAILATVLAAVLPARRAAALNPVDVIR
jgi:lipoprotein-releasing system permease protein